MSSPYSMSKRRKVYKKAGGHCAYCGRPLAPFSAFGEWHAEHVVPKSLGGDDSIENLVPACPRCNAAKATKSPAELATWIKTSTVADLRSATRRLGHFMNQIEIDGWTVKALRETLFEMMNIIEYDLSTSFYLSELNKREES